ncbi:uncharacterized protein F5147DRAFT_675960 [Suillus discolor]|uniref:Uncharacterized protein n=1 Tax=Suillus discolor TaxID=1912936 RepID=A0A9P7JYF6_9AGAM|nr:uncharacterized protein F5147DRAFT_675960 [Suillus discolor]KAG2116096.1 hypothetical protein F5147DRAFT_675960 [Suillus discolor]
MKFISLTTTVIMSAAVLSGIVTVQGSNPNGMPCAHNGEYECGTLAGYNNGNQFLFYCSESNMVEVAGDCGCKTCCSILDGGNTGSCIINPFRPSHLT